MSIKIIEEDLTLTREDYERYMIDWHEDCKYNLSPVSFETYIIRRKRKLNEEKKQLLNEGVE
ncbi:MAG: hypothetical protein ACRDFB_04950 [Rhabdochlamydiaceae bacterium]